MYLEIDSVLRYIHQNPMKTGEIEKKATYQWSSYWEYLGENRLVDTDFAMGIFSPETEIAVERFRRFMNEKAEDIGIMVHGTYKLTDQELNLLYKKQPNLLFQRNCK